MLWLKRNLLFAVGSLIGLGLLGGAGFYLFTELRENKVVDDQLGEQTAESDRLGKLDPYPNAKNIEAVKADQQRVLDYVGQAYRAFKPMDYHKINSAEFRQKLNRTIYDLTKMAEQSSVGLPAKYNFSFEVQSKNLNFASNSIPMLTEQLVDISAFCSILFQAKINKLEGVKRVRVSTDDPTGSSDYLEQRPDTNALTGAVLSPYEVTIQCFTPELAAVLDGLMRSPHGLIVQTLTVEPAPASALTQPETPQPAYVLPPVYYPSPLLPFPNPKSDMRMMQRYGIRPPPTAAPAPLYRPPAPGVPAKTLTTVINEKMLRMTLRIEVLKHAEAVKKAK